MARGPSRTQAIRDFILSQVALHPTAIGRITGARFGVSRQAVNKHISALVAAGLLVATGTTKGRHYSLAALKQEEVRLRIRAGLAEDVIWREAIARHLAGLPGNVLDIWHYGCTEMLNNAIEHSAGGNLVVRIQRTARDIEIMLADDGVGIFAKIQRELKLSDPREAILELAKGKLTTDPERHTGEGIYFASRMFDEFSIVSGGLFFTHQHTAPEDWLLQASATGLGTAVYMRSANDSPRSMAAVFDQSALPEDDYAFRRTIVPVRLAQIGKQNLVSRSQARRLVARFEQFRTVVLDFTGVEMIGQAFADEVFRVFQRTHPGVELVASNANAAVTRMIRRAKAHTGTG